jgi:NAD(P)-dependent dehydrogenase (short-subunit alcohol dehydrogenase family)
MEQGGHRANLPHPPPPRIVFWRIRQGMPSFRQHTLGLSADIDRVTPTGARPMTTITLVTGASRGLGRNTALSIARHGGDVVITYRSQAEEAQAVVAEIVGMGRKAIAFPLDTGDVAAFLSFADSLRAALRETWSRETFDHLVNNAGHGDYALIGQTSEAQFDGLVDVHFKGVFFLTQALLPLLADGGRIVNLSSGLTRACYPGYAAYAAVKGAVEVLTRYMAAELGSRGIAVNTVAPGAIETDFGGGAVRDNPDLNRQFAALTALGRVGLPDDIGPMIASLLSQDNRWVNAQRIEVSGGQRI